MERSARKSRFAQRIESRWLGDRRGVEDHRVARKAAIVCRTDHFLDRFVQLRVTHSDNHHVCSRGVGWNISRRSSDPRWVLAVQPDNGDP
jgi:hypothetical protein